MKKVLVSLTLAMLGSAAYAGPMSLNLSVSGIEASGVTPGGSVVFFGATRAVGEWLHVSSFTHERLSDNDRDGVVILPVSASATGSAIWFAVDLATGQEAMGVPAGSEALPSSASLNPVSMGGAGESLEIAHSSVELMLIRPGVGAWVGRVVDGGSTDLGASSDGKVVASLSALSLVPASGFGGLPPSTPTALQSGDAVISVDSRTLEYLVTHFSK